MGKRSAGFSARRTNVYSLNVAELNCLPLGQCAHLCQQAACHAVRAAQGFVAISDSMLPLRLSRLQQLLSDSSKADRF